MFTSTKENSNEDFGWIIGATQVFQVSKISQIAQECSERGKKQAFSKKDPKNACAKKWDPYNAPPLRRQSGTLHKMVGTTKRKILKNGVDSERGKRNIRHLATER
ncbi:hypothetical protein [Citrobacter koseri]|uniref:hypothetical protein n=1 Tax=Citrobacter koseri TaxID=545 RepID=UPI00397D94F9